MATAGLSDGRAGVAVQTVVQFVDDLDGGEAAETVLFGLDGVGYEVDLSAANAAALRTLLRRYVAAARPTGRVVAGSASRVRRAMARANQPRPAGDDVGDTVPVGAVAAAGAAPAPVRGRAAEAAAEVARVTFSDHTAG